MVVRLILSVQKKLEVSKNSEITEVISLSVSDANITTVFNNTKLFYRNFRRKDAKHIKIRYFSTLIPFVLIYTNQSVFI